MTTCYLSTCKLHLPEIIGLKNLFLGMNAVGLSSCLRYSIIKTTILFSLQIHKAIDIWRALEQGEFLCKLVAKKTDVRDLTRC